MLSPIHPRPVLAPLASGPVVPARVTPPAARTAAPAPLKSYGELTSTQRSLLGPDGQARFDGLTRKEKAVFLLHTARLARDGVDLSGLRLKPDGIQGNSVRVQLLFENDPAAVQRFKDQVQQGVDAGRLIDDKPFSLFHRGYDESGAREKIANYPLQIGFGPEGVFVDMDRYNPRAGTWSWIKHWGEILTPGNLDPEAAARALGENIWSSARRTTSGRAAA